MVMPILKRVVPILTILSTLVLGFLVLAALLLAKRRAHKTLALMGILVLGAILIALRPVCYPMTAADVAEFEEVSRPIEERRETNFYGLRTFQQREGQWYYCKSAIQFWFFF